MKRAPKEGTRIRDTLIHTLKSPIKFYNIYAENLVHTYGGPALGASVSVSLFELYSDDLEFSVCSVPSSSYTFCLLSCGLPRILTGLKALCRNQHNFSMLTELCMCCPQQCGPNVSFQRANHYLGNSQGCLSISMVPT